jgi:SAM-dependent methyltransferase
MQRDYPVFDNFVQNIFIKSPMQKKYILKHLEKADNLFWQRAEEFANGLMKYLREEGISLDDCVDAYLMMCGKMLAEQIKFRRTGKYSCESADQANKHVYSAEKEMASYVLGLSMSQFLWPNHYSLYDFFIRESKKIPKVESYLEIGPGHGLYLAESILNFSEASFRAVDISPISKRISERLVRHFTGSDKCVFEVKDVTVLEGEKYEYIVMCEVLEHLDDPASMMTKIHNLLHEGGHAFVTTCANCPAVDHVYLFGSIDEIRQLVQQAGFEILSELSLPVEQLPESQWTEKQVEVNYGAMLKRL